MPKIEINGKEYITGRATLGDIQRTEETTGFTASEILDTITPDPKDPLGKNKKVNLKIISTLCFWAIERAYPNEFISPLEFLDKFSITNKSIDMIAQFYKDLLRTPEIEINNNEGDLEEEKKGKAGAGKKQSSTPLEPESNLLNSGA